MKEKKPEVPKSKTGKYQRWGRRAVDALARTCLPEVTFIMTLVLGRYLKNADFSYPRELLFPMAAFLIICSVTYYAYRLALRQVYAAHLAALPMSYMLYSFQQYTGAGYKLVRVLLPGSWETQFGMSLVLVAIFAVLFGVLGWGIAKLTRHIKAVRNFQVQKVLMFVVLFLFATQFTKAAVFWVSNLNELSYNYTFNAPKQDASKVTNKPNIYYFVFDRYARNDTLKTIYNFDNTYFTDFLAGQGFVTKPAAYANYPFTMSSVSSTLLMDYHTELGKKFGNDHLHTAFPYRTLLNDPPVARLLKQNGYTYNQVSSWWDFSRIGIHADTNLTESFRLNLFNGHFFMSDLQRDIINGGIMSPWLKKGITIGKTTLIQYDRDTNPRQNFEAQMSALKDLAAKRNTAPQFTFAHVLMPHDPYIFMPDGSDTKYDGNRTDNGLDERLKYTNQLTYANKRYEELLGNIRRNDPGAVIILQADEGPYPKQFRYTLTPDHFYTPADLPLPEMKQKVGILASYYMPDTDKEDINEKIHSSVDPFRFVLTRYLGYDLDPLPACHFANGNKFSLYAYQDLTEKLTGHSNPDCDQYK